MKIIKISVISLTLIVVVSILLINKDRWWVIFNGADAEHYAMSLLSGSESKDIPDKFIDYVITANKESVIFSKPHHEVVYGYFPEKEPAEIETSIPSLDWVRVSEKWFVYRLKG